MKLPEGKEVFECSLATIWFNDDGILCCLAKDIPNNLTKTKEVVELVDTVTKKEKVCILVDATLVHPFDKATRNYALFQLTRSYKAMAFVSNSMVGSMVVNIFLSVQSPSAPVQSFAKEEEALKWLKTFL